MTHRSTSSFYTALDEDARLAAAMKGLSAAVRTGERFDAERAARAAALAAALRALGCMARELLAWPRGARTARAAISAAPRA